MNERIEKLAEQAMESTGVEGIGGSYMELNPEKFAQLIVQECAAAIATDAKKFPPTDLTWIAAMEESARVVKAHFGVED